MATVSLPSTASATSLPRKHRQFEDELIYTDDGEVLHAQFLWPRPPIRPRRLVFIAPLVGAGGAQMIMLFRTLIRRGSVLMSFEYRGNGKSTGTFELNKSIVDIRNAMIWAWHYANERNLPLHGFSACFGALALMAQFKPGGCGSLVRSLSFVAPLYKVNQILRVEDLVAVIGPEWTPEQLVAAFERREFDTASEEFRVALQRYLKHVFPPDFDIGVDYFEQLRYERMKMTETFLQFARDGYIDDVYVPPEIPCNLFLGTNDEMLSHQTVEGREKYKRGFSEHVPHAVYHEHEFDHFGRGVEHDVVMDLIADLFDRYDSTPIPPHHMDRVIKLRGALPQPVLRR